MKLPWQKTRITSEKSRPRKSRQASKKVAQSERYLQWRPSQRHLLYALALLMAAYVIYLLPKEQWLPIDKIRISGKFQHLDTGMVEQQLHPYLGQGFFTIDIQALQDVLHAQPWIKTVSIRRVWPDRVDVAIEEKTAVARWDQQHLLSQQGVIFKTSTATFQSLPQISGYHQHTRRLLSDYVALRQRLMTMDIQLSALLEDNKGALTLELNGQTRVKLGEADRERKINHLMAVYKAKIKPRLQDIEQIDFRYSNGFAIAWKAQQEQGQMHRQTRGSKNV